MLRRMLSFLLCVTISCAALTACAQSSADTAVSDSSVTDSGVNSDASSASGSAGVSDASSASGSAGISDASSASGSADISDPSDSSEITSNAHFRGDRPLQEIYDPDKDDPSAPVGTDPFYPDSLDRVIVGEDDRVTVTDTGVFPFSAIAFMKVRAKCGCSKECSGFMAGPSGLITAAHCLQCLEHHALLDHVDFYFGYQSDNNYLYRYSGDFEYIFGTDFLDTGGAYSKEWDYGYVLFDESIGYNTGWFGIASLEDIDITSEVLTVAGYRDGILKFDSGFATVENPRIISYTADMCPGNSGCPVFFYRGRDVYATAINVAENEARQKNYGRRINGWLYDQMEEDGVFD